MALTHNMTNKVPTGVTKGTVSASKSDWRIVAGYLARWHTRGLHRRIAEADGLIMQAMGYVWGWQDAGRQPKDSQVAWDFAYWYGVQVVEYLAEVRHSRGPVQDAWQQYLKLHTEGE